MLPFIPVSVARGTGIYDLKVPWCTKLSARKILYIPLLTHMPHGIVCVESSILPLHDQRHMDGTR